VTPPSAARRSSPIKLIGLVERGIGSNGGLLAGVLGTRKKSSRRPTDENRNQLMARTRVCAALQRRRSRGANRGTVKTHRKVFPPPTRNRHLAQVDLRQATNNTRVVAFEKISTI
jgi:hypothetical protein